ncbi:MAG: polyribonucleotide nucleotidyltransferase, partial [Leptospiraceae bacterium]|nr:polyribonucleotide nucleotidyltransferase [Leptospiraceae bacterium]
MAIFRHEIESNGRTVSIETGNWAKQAHGAIVYRTGNVVLLATVCAEREAKEGQDFFPLTVDYREKFYAAGRIPGGYFKRETRPAEHETLLSRLIDRPIRPLFPEGYFAEVQLLITVLSADDNIAIEGHAITAASAALMISDIPFDGPIAGVLIGRVDGEYVVDPGVAEREKSDLDLLVAGSRNAITMI